MSMTAPRVTPTDYGGAEWEGGDCVAVHVHRSERTDALLRGLAELLTSTPADPFTPDIVAVPTPGIERFIAHGLGAALGTSAARTDGVCANVHFPSPAVLTNQVISQATGVDPRADPSRLTGYKVNKKTIRVPVDWEPDAVLLRDMAAAHRGYLRLKAAIGQSGAATSRPAAEATSACRWS